MAEDASNANASASLDAGGADASASTSGASGAATLSVTGAPDDGIVTDPSVRSRLSALLPALKAALTAPTTSGDENRAIPTPNGELAALDLATLTYHLQLFQERFLGAHALASASSSASAEALPIRIPARLFLTSGSVLQHAAPLEPEQAPLHFVLLYALQHLQRTAHIGWLDLAQLNLSPAFAAAATAAAAEAPEGQASEGGIAEKARTTRAYYVELILSVRQALKEKKLIADVRVAAPADWPQGQKEYYRSLASKLDGECQNGLMPTVSSTATSLRAETFHSHPTCLFPPAHNS